MSENQKVAFLHGGPLSKGIAVLLAIIIVLSLVSFLLYLQERDYHDAKYRAQYIIVDGMVTDMTIVSESLSLIAGNSTSTSNEYRDRVALVEIARLNGISNSARTLSAMYAGDDEKSYPFSRVSQALTHVQSTLDWDIGTWNRSGWADEIMGFAYDISDLASEFEKGIDQGRSPYDNPYSLVDRMDLNKITSIANAIYPVPPVVY